MFVLWFLFASHSCNFFCRATISRRTARMLFLSSDSSWFTMRLKFLIWLDKTAQVTFGYPHVCSATTFAKFFFLINNAPTAHDNFWNPISVRMHYLPYSLLLCREMSIDFAKGCLLSGVFSCLDSLLLLHDFVILYYLIFLKCEGPWSEKDGSVLCWPMSDSF